LRPHLAQIPPAKDSLDKCHSWCNSTPRMNWYDAKGDPAARLRQRKHTLLRSLQIPPDALSGSLALTHSRCGKPNCRCAQGEGHPSWSLTFMVDGKKRVERIPEEWVENIRDAIAEVFAANSQLLALWRKQSAKKRRKKA